jgi:hypothetical protein
VLVRRVVAAREAAKNGTAFVPATAAGTSDEKSKKEVTRFGSHEEDAGKEKKWCCTIM